jgi:hypothetical protein
MPPGSADDSTARVAQAYLEWAYLEEYLKSIGYSLEQLRTLPGARARALMRDASLFASMRLSEVEARSHLLEELHGGPTPLG